MDELGELSELRRLKDFGLISSYADYQALPLGVLEDARLLLEFESKAQEAQRAKGARRGVHR